MNTKGKVHSYKELSQYRLGCEQDDWSWIRGRGNDRMFFRHRIQTESRAHPTSYPRGTEGTLPRGWNVRGVNLTIHIHLMPSLRIRKAIPPLPQHLFMVWCSVKLRDNFRLTLLYHKLQTCLM